MGVSPHGPEPCASAKFRQSPSNGEMYPPSQVAECISASTARTCLLRLHPQRIYRIPGPGSTSGPTEGGPMGILRDFERRLETMFECFFARALPGGGLQPVELGKRMVRAMEEQKTVSVANVYVPNEFTFFVSSKDAERLRPVENALGQELAAVARRAAASEGWRLLGPPVIRLVEDETTAAGTFRIEAAVVEGLDEQAEAAGPHTALMQMSSAQDS